MTTTMTMTSSNESPTPTELRHFGLIMAAMLILIFGLLLPWLWGFAWPRWPWIAAAAFALCALALPKGLGPIFTVWMKIATVLGWINTRLILGIAFFLIILPTGLISRIVRKDPLGKQLQPDATTYRIHRDPLKPNHLEKPY